MNLSFLYNRNNLRISVLVFVYSVALSLSLCFAWLIRFDFSIPEASHNTVWISIIWIVLLKLIALSFSRQYSGLLSYFGIQDLIRLFLAMTSVSGIIIVIWLGVNNPAYFIPPRGVILMDFVLSFMGLASIRLLMRLYREKENDDKDIQKKFFKKVGIVGAGHSGANLVKELFVRKGLGYEPKYFFDDNSNKYNSRIHGIPVLGKPEMLLDKDFHYSLDKLIIALPAASSRRIKEVISIANQAGLTCEIVPSMEELTTGRVKVSKLRRIQIQDLLGRDPVQLQTENIKQLIQDKVVVVTGAGGSIGSELCRQIINYNTKRLLLIEQCEVQMFSIYQELVEQGHNNAILPLIADVLDLHRVESIFKRYKPDLVFHAAAHKHVSLMECQPAETFRNNTLGTVGLAEIAIRYGVERFLMVSTDKAINPTSVMGATKRLAEIFQ